MGYTKRTSFMTGFNLGQISEFSLIVGALAYESGKITEVSLSIITLIALITIAISSYLITYSNDIYRIVSPLMNIFEKKGKKINEESYDENEMYDTLLFGFNRTGSALLSAIRKSSKKFLIVEFNPEIIKELITQKIPCKYGDAHDIELLNDQVILSSYT